MDFYAFLSANGSFLAGIGILSIIIATIIVVIRSLRASPPSSRKVIITAIAIPFVLLSMSTFAACNSVNKSGSTGGSREPSSSSSPQPVINDAVYASPGDNLQQMAGNLSAGKTLILRDGFYNQGLIVEHVHGTATAPITIMAEHDGKAIIDGGGPTRQTVWIEFSSYIIVQGIVAQHGQEPVVVYGPADHIIIRRVTAHDAAPGNYHVFDIEFSASNVLVEDCAGWGEGRYIFVAYKSTNVTFRRDWAYWQHEDNSPDNPRADYSAYSASNVTFENDIGIGAYPRPGIHDDNSYNAVYETATGGFSTDGFPTNNTKYIGDIFYNNMDGIYFNQTSGENSQIINSYIETPANMPGPAGSTTNEQGTGFTWMNPYSGSITNSTFTNTPVAASLQNGSATITNTVFYKNGQAINGDFSHSYSNFWQNGSIGADLVFPDQQVDPGYDTNKYGRGAYLFIPPNSPLKHAGQNGQGIGANILYESVDGQFTNTPLWPWPMEDRIKAETGMSVTWASSGGIWKTLDGVYPTATLPAPSTSSLLASPLLSPLFSILREEDITRRWMKR
jgi:Chondroitinase B